MAIPRRVAWPAGVDRERDFVTATLGYEIGERCLLLAAWSNGRAYARDAGGRYTEPWFDLYDRDEFSASSLLLYDRDSGAFRLASATAVNKLIAGLNAMQVALAPTGKAPPRLAYVV